MRGLWVVLCVSGALVCTLLLAILGLEIFAARSDANLFSSLLGDYLWMIMFLVGFGAACLVGLFLRPAQIDQLTSEDAPPAPWIEKMRHGRDRDNERN